MCIFVRNNIFRISLQLEFPISDSIVNVERTFRLLNIITILGILTFPYFPQMRQEPRSNYKISTFVELVTSEEQRLRGT